MRRSFLLQLFAAFVISVQCQVIVNTENEYAGSLCYTKNGGQGVCRQSCDGTGQNGAADICNSGKSPVLYCCVDHSFAKLYPTLHKGCVSRLLAKNLDVKRSRAEFYAQNKLNEMATSNHYRSLAMAETCKKDALELELGERANFLKYCNKVATEEYSDMRRGVRYAFYKDPSLVGIGFYNGLNNIRWICGGHFIHDFYVLTSANCILEQSDVPNIIRFGSNNLYDGQFSNVDTQFSRTLVIQDIITRDDYNKDNLRGDVALLRIGRDVNSVPKYLLQLNPTPTCLWSKNEIPTQNLTISAYTHVLHTGEVSPSDPTNCAKKLGRNELENTTSCFVCNFQDKGSITASLQYEEKGLLMHVPHLVAMGSCRMPCKDSEPAVFTLIYPHLEWIESVISRDE